MTINFYKTGGWLQRMKPPAPAIPAMGAVVALIGLGLAIGNRDGVLAAFCFSSFTWATFLALELYKK